VGIVGSEYCRCTTNYTQDMQDAWTEVTPGSEGKRQKRIRATVARYPYHDEGRNSDVDVNTIPRGTRD
jgi:hypothetical protein